MRSLIPALAATLIIGGCGSRDAAPENTGDADKKTPASAVEQVSVSPLDERVLATLPKGSKPYVETWPGGQPRARGFICDDKLVGPFEYGYESGRLRSKGTYVYGQLEDGEWTHWYPSGLKQMQGSYRRGKRHGPWTFWHPTGNKAAEGDYDADRRLGEWRSWHANGRAASHGWFERDTRVGRWSYWDENGEDAGYMVERDTERSRAYRKY